MITIIILTANRRPQLQATLAALDTQRDAPPWEAVILDNASTDDTPAWLREHTFERWKVVRVEPSHPYAEARNRAVAEAAGEIIAFLDDDCVPEPGWLAALTAPFAEGADAVGGMVLPAPDHKPPPWWDARMNWIVGLTPPLPPDDAEGARVYPSTSNMAVRREIAVRHPFPEISVVSQTSKSSEPMASEVPPSPKQNWRSKMPGVMWNEKNAYLFGREDAEAWRRWRLAGARTAWAQDAVVRHHFHQGRYRWEYVKGRAIKDGRAFWRRRPAEAHLEKAWWDVMDLPRAALAEIYGNATVSSSKDSNVARNSRNSGELRQLPRSHPGAYPLLWACRQWGVISEAARAEKAAEAGATPDYRMAVERPLKLLVRYAAAQAKAVARPLAAQALTALRRKPAADDEITGIALVCCGYLGDAVLIAPLALALRRRYPGVPLHLITLPSGEALHGPPENRLFDSIVTVPHRRRRLMAERVREIYSSRGINLAVFTYCHLDDPQELLLQGVRTVGWDQDAGFPRRLHYDLLDRRVTKNLAAPEMRNLAALFVALGGEDALPMHRFAPPEEARAKARALMSEAGLEPGRFVCLHPGAGYAAKLWTPEGWGETARALEEGGEIKCAFVGGEDMRAEVEAWRGVWAFGAANFCGGTDIWTMGALLAESALLITTDSGPKHLAMALGAPTVTLYGASDERRWGAWREPEKHRAVRAFFNHLTGDEKTGEPENIEMRAIPPAMVLAAAASLLNKAG